MGVPANAVASLRGTVAVEILWIISRAEPASVLLIREPPSAKIIAYVHALGAPILSNSGYAGLSAHFMPPRPCLAPVSAASARELGAIVQQYESHLADIANRQQDRSSHSYPQLTGSHSFQGTQFSPSPCSSLMRLLFSSISGSLPGFGCGTHSLSRRLPKGLRSHLRISAQESFLNSPDSDMPSCEFSKHCLKNSHPGSPGSSPFGGAGQPGGVIA